MVGRQAIPPAKIEMVGRQAILRDKKEMVGRQAQWLLSNRYIINTHACDGMFLILLFAWNWIKKKVKEQVGLKATVVRRYC